MKFEIISINKENNRIGVEVEISETRERRNFGYPLGEGWENEINGEPKFLRDIKRKLKEEQEIKKQPIDVSKFEKKYEGKKIKLE